MKELRKLFRQHKPLVWAALLFIVSLFAIVQGVLPLLGSLGEVQGRLGTLRRDVAALQEKTRVLESVDPEELRMKLTALLSAVPADKSLPTLFSTIEGLSAQTGVATQNMAISSGGLIATDSAKKQSAEEAKIGSNVLPFSLTSAGSLENIRSFLSTSITIRRFLRIRNFDVTFSGSASATARFSMDAFYAALPANLGAVDMPVAALSEIDERTISRVTGLPSFTEQGENPSNLPLGKTDPFAR